MSFTASEVARAGAAGMKLGPGHKMLDIELAWGGGVSKDRVGANLHFSPET